MMSNGMYKFITTKDGETAQRMIDENFTLISQANGTWTFLNKCDQLNFASNEKTVLTNNLCI